MNSKILFAIIIIFAITCNCPTAFSMNDDPKFSVSGYVKDARNGEELIGATIYIEELKSGTITNVYGFFSLTLRSGQYTIKVSYMGYESFSQVIDLKSNLRLNIELKPLIKTLSEVKIVADAPNVNITRNEMSVAKMDSKQIEKIPALMGEVDVIKAIQLLPGVSSVSEGSSGFSVRGGGIDQNLIILDEATVYNASHLLGFFSVFNNDAIKDLKIYKGDMPSEYGGRMSSVVDIRMKEGNQKKLSGSGGVGTISGRAMLEGPLWEDHTSFLIAGRRTWADIFIPLAKDTSLHDNRIFFYDLNAKINHRVDDNNRIFFSGYFGRDVFKNQFSEITFGNSTFTARWNHLFSEKLFSNLALTYSNYYYSLGSDAIEANSFIWAAEMTDVALKYDLGYFFTPDILIKYGVNIIFHDFQPGLARGIGAESIINKIQMPTKQAFEFAGYLSSDHKISSLLTLKYGLRLSGFTNYNSDSVYFYDSQYRLTDIKDYSNRFFGSYWNWEPRLGLVYLLSENSSIKAFYTRNAQYLQMAQNSNAGTPLDIWFSSSNNVKPQISDQVGVGYFRNFYSNHIETSVELFYKQMNQTVDFKDFANLLLNSRMEGELRYGKSYSYGAEFLFKINFEKLSGWLAYTYSHAKRKIDEVNFGREYLAPYDKPHDVSIVINYAATKRFSIGANWVYSTGVPVTFPSGKAIIAGTAIPIYTGRNEYRMPNYHRLDLSLSIKNKPKPERKWESEFNLSFYNLYSRKNAWAINFINDDENPERIKAVMTYLFPIVPSISYNFRF